jgi:folate-dependent phosphoribosylglycinamide formyltransferase PurN
MDISQLENLAIMSLNFAFLVLEEHPYGREMLRILLENDLAPEMIIQEVSDVGDEEREKFLARIAGQPVPPRLTQLITGRKIPLYCVSNHNARGCEELLTIDKPEVLVLGGTRIIKPNILEVPRQATVNSHPGILPWLRGSASVGWALYKDMPQGATAHFVTPGIDAGDIIVSRQLPVYRHDTYESLNYRVAILAGELMVETLTHIKKGKVPRTSQDPNVGETLKVIPDDLLAEGKQRLATGRYSHYAD